MTKNTTTTNRYRIPADRIQNLEIDRNGRIAPRLHDLEPMDNTLLSVLYPGIKIASVNVPTEPLDDFEESQVENALARLIWNDVHYKLVGASGSAKKGKFYFVDQEHSRSIAERFQHSPQAAIVYLGILVSSCKVMMEVPEARVLVVSDCVLGTNDCGSWISRSKFQLLQEKHDEELLSAQVNRLRRERYGMVREEDLDDEEKLVLVQDAKHEISRKLLPSGRFYQFRMAFAGTQAKGSFKIMEDDVADALEADFILPESAVKPGVTTKEDREENSEPGRRFAGNVAVGIREVSRQLEFESSYTLVEHAPEDSIQLEILPQAMKQVAKLSEAVGKGRYEELLEILGRHPDKSSDALELDPNEEFRVVEGLLLADASGEIVRHPYVNNQLNKLLARWAFKTATGGGFRLPGFALMHDGYLFLKDGKVFSGSDWIPEHKAIVQLASRYGLCVRYPIRMVDDLLPFGNLSDAEIIAQLNEDLRRQNCRLTESEAHDLVARQLRLEGTYVLHSETAKKNGGDYDFDWVCVVEEDRFPRFVKNRFSRGVGQQQGKNKAKHKARDPWFNLEHVAMKARGNHIGSITDLMTSCRAAGREELALQLAKELQNALDSLKWQVQPDLKLVAEIRQQVGQAAAWLRYKNERRVSDLPLHLETEKTDRIGRLYNHVRKQIEDLLINKAPIEAFKALVVGEQVTREMLEACRFVNRVYAAKIGEIAERREQLKKQLEKAKAEWDEVRQSPDKELRRQKLFAKTQAYAACHSDEERGKYEITAILAFIRIWAQNKVENRMGWLQALNRIVCNGQRSSGSILFLAFPQEMIVKLAERTGGKPVRVHVPRLYEGFVRIDPSGRTFLVDPLKDGGQKHTFLFKLKDGKILLDDKPEQTESTSTEHHDPAEAETESESTAQAAVSDDAVEFPPIHPDWEVDDVSWVM